MGWDRDGGGFLGYGFSSLFDNFLYDLFVTTVMVTCGWSGASRCDDDDDEGWWMDG